MPGLRVLYHEHDSPDTATGGSKSDSPRPQTHSPAAPIAASSLTRHVSSASRPRPDTPGSRSASGIARLFKEAAQPHGPAHGPLVLLYHGSIVPDRLPLAVVNALALLPGNVSLRVVGYETAGSLGYVAKLRELADRAWA